MKKCPKCYKEMYDDVFTCPACHTPYVEPPEPFEQRPMLPIAVKVFGFILLGISIFQASSFLHDEYPNDYQVQAAVFAVVGGIAQAVLFVTVGLIADHVIAFKRAEDNRRKKESTPRPESSVLI